MVILRSNILFLFACQLLSLWFSSTLVSSELSLEEKALYISENNCEKLEDSSTGGPILLQASHVVLLGRAKMIKETYGRNNGRYSMTVMPQCIQKGNVSVREIVVRNLGKTKCGASDVEKGKDYLFFLRRTSDPKVFEATNEGAQMVDGYTLWNPVFTMFCGIKLIKRCEDAVCPEACSYSPPDGACIPTEMTVTDTFNVLYPDGLPKSTTTTTTTTTTPTTTTTMPEKETKTKINPKKGSSDKTESNASTAVNNCANTTSPDLLSLQITVLKAQLSAATATKEAMLELKAAALQTQAWINRQVQKSAPFN